jgi:ankyrin repeat protein
MKRIRLGRRQTASILLAGLLAVCLLMVVMACGRVGLNDSLRDAVDRGDVAAVRSLLDQGADPNTRYPPDGVPGVVGRFALAFGVAGTDSCTNTVLVHAACSRHTAIAKLLVTRGADVNAPQDSKLSPLQWAWLTKNKELETFLRNAGAK